MAILLRRIEMVAWAGEVVGYKSGLALTEDELRGFVPEEHIEMWSGDGGATLRVRSEVLEDLIDALLHGVGAVRTRGVVVPGIRLFHKYKSDPKEAGIYYDVSDLFAEWIGIDLKGEHVRPPGPRRMMTRFMAISGAARGDHVAQCDARDFVGRARVLHGPHGEKIAHEFLEELDSFRVRLPWDGCRHVEWSDTLELQALFESESLQASHGSFVDQRFIDYLAENFDDVDRMNWRKFEGLTGEYFERAGYHVDMGPGRNDNGVDVRVWPRDGDTTSPPAVLIQCKRQREKVEKVVVKALYADILDEGAKSGLIVTSRALAPGAKNVCTARGYPIREVDRRQLQRWIAAMRTPGTGVFLGE